MVNKTNIASHIVTSAAYLLFYRRRSEGPLGGPFFENLMSETGHSGEDQTSQNDSRNQSPSALTGEGKRLDDSSRFGLSSASHGVGAGHQAGGGGLEVATSMEAITDDMGDELPDYSVHDPNTDAPFVSMETDDLDGSEIDRPSFGILRSAQEPNWKGFGIRHGSVSSSNAVNIDDEDDRSQPEWEGIYGKPGTPDGSIANQDDGPVTEIKLSEGEESTSPKAE